MGALGALLRETGWDPETAETTVGTSAGAVIAALVAGSHQPWRLLEAEFEEEFLDVLGGAVYRVDRPDRFWRWGSWRMVVEAWRGGGDATLSRLWAGVLPHGLVSTDDLERMVDHRVPHWPRHPRLRLVATDYQSGERHVFSGPGRHGASVGRAVAASCAIPGFYQPVAFDSHRYVDGGVTSSANLDLLVGEGLDLAICLLPLSPATAIVRRTPFARFRTAFQRTLLRQVAAVEASGTPVMLIEPEGRAADLIGLNFMNRRRAHAVAHAGAETVQHELREPEHAELVAILRQAARKPAVPR